MPVTAPAGMNADRLIWVGVVNGDPSFGLSRIVIIKTGATIANTAEMNRIRAREINISSSRELM
jgi:hypothetical protein